MKDKKAIFGQKQTNFSTQNVLQLKFLDAQSQKKYFQSCIQTNAQQSGCSCMMDKL